MIDIITHIGYKNTVAVKEENGVPLLPVGGEIKVEEKQLFSLFIQYPAE